MSRLKALIQRIEHKLDLYSQRMSRKHPHIFFFTVLIGTLLLILLFVCIGAMILALPLSLIPDWI